MSQKYINFLFETCLFSGFLHFSSEKTPITAKLSTSVIRSPKTIKKVEMYGIEIPISTYRTQGAITFKVLSLKHTEISASRYFLCYKKKFQPKTCWNFYSQNAVRL